MGTATSKLEQDAGGLIIGRLPGIGEETRKAGQRLPPNTVKSVPEDWEYIEVPYQLISSSYSQLPARACMTLSLPAVMFGQVATLQQLRPYSTEKDCHRNVRAAGACRGDFDQRR